MRRLPLAFLLSLLCACGERGEADCSDHKDDDNDGLVDCDDPDCSTDLACTEGDTDTGCAPRDWFPDSDGDGYGAGPAVQTCEQPSNYVDNDDDCDDDDDEIHPDAEDLCDGVDNDCDGQVDDGHERLTWYEDLDGDDYGTDASSIIGCTQPAGYADNTDDCDDTDADIHPGAEETCDGVDQDCDGETDEGAAPVPWYPDADGDGYGLEDGSVETCPAPEGYADQAGDCDDNNAAVNPGAEEILDGLDNDCDGLPSWIVMTDQPGDSIYLLGLDGTVLDTLNVVSSCDGPAGVTRDPSGRAYVSCSGNDTLLFVETDGSTSNQLLDDPACDTASVAWSPDETWAAGGFLYLSCDYSGLFLDTQGNLLAEVPLSDARQPAADRRGRVWAGESSGEVYRLDPDDYEVVFDIGNSLGGIAVEPDGTVWVSDDDRHEVCQVDPVSLDSSLCVDTGSYYPHHIAFDRSGYAYVVHTNDLVVIDTVTDSVAFTEPDAFTHGFTVGLGLDGTLWTQDMPKGEWAMWSGHGESIRAVGAIDASGGYHYGDFTGSQARWLSKPGGQGLSVQDALICDVSSYELRSSLDIDGDGQHDLVTSPQGSSSGACIWKGDELADWASSGPSACWTGGSIAYAHVGDLDGDGLDDLLLPDTDAAEAYLFFGGSFPSTGAGDLADTADVVLDITSPDGSFNGPAGYAHIADLDGDGFDDLALGTNTHSSSSLGKGWFLFGRDRLDWETLDGQNLFDAADVTLESDALGMGRPVALVGDLDGDGLSELALGAGNETDGNTRRSAVVLYWGQDVVDAAAGSGALTAVEAVELWVDQGYSDGTAGGLAYPFPVGDLDGDGLAELMATAPNGDFEGTDYGGAVLVYGGEDLTASGAVDSIATVFGATVGTQGMGSFQLPVGDIDHDGFDDLMLTNREHDEGGASAGRLSILFGGSLRWERHTEWLPLTYAETSFDGEEGDQLAYGVVGDFDGDGWLELAVGGADRFYVLEDHTAWPRSSD